MGCNIEDFKNARGMWGKGKTVLNTQFQTVMYQKWNSIRCRCRTGSSAQRVRPTYIGCTMSSAFRDYQFFGDWYSSQVGYGIKGYQIDKDVLVRGNKVYSEDSCVLIPQQLNLFLVVPINSREGYPTGVCRHSRSGTFCAQVKVSNKTKNLGVYPTLDAALAAYKVGKEAEARRWYERLKAGEFIVDERVIERMRTWTLEGD